MAGATLALILLPLDSVVVQFCVGVLALWGFLSYIFILRSQMKKSKVKFFFHNPCPVGDKIVFVNVKRLVEGVVPIINFGFATANFVYLKLEKKLPFRINLVLKSVIVLITGFKSMVAHATEPKRCARRLGAGSLVEITMIEDLLSTIYHQIFDDKEDSVKSFAESFAVDLNMIGKEPGDISESRPSVSELITRYEALSMTPSNS